MWTIRFTYIRPYLRSSLTGVFQAKVLLLMSYFITVHRNLCVKVQIVEFVTTVSDQGPSLRDPHHILRNVYNPMNGPLFCTAQFSSVWYHTKVNSARNL
jgi:hypothetical protein